MKKENVYTAIAVVAAAVAAITLAVLLIFSLRTEFSPKPTQYPNTEWVSEDGAFRLSVGEYDNDTYQCRAVLVYTAPDGVETSYTVSDGAHSVVGVYISENDIDEWLRVKCNKDGFTVRVNRTADFEYSGAYDKNSLLKFNRV